MTQRIVTLNADAETWRWLVKMASNNEMSVDGFASFLIDQGRSNVRDAVRFPTFVAIPLEGWRKKFQEPV